jgi:LAO/AO transport system kinase
MATEAELLVRVQRGDPAALSRLCRRLEEGLCSDSTLEALDVLSKGRWTVGVTGSPGAGKSTLVSRLVRRFRARGLRVGVVAIDPTSPFTGGAILGDRIRMQEHGEDPEVFVRSLATRGAHGGIAPATLDVARALAVWGAGVVLIETVGVGQAEVEVMRLADTVLVVVAPGMGDDVQAAKAGILEIADVLVVNKGDKPEAARTFAELLAMLSLSRVTASSHDVGGHGAHSTLGATLASPAQFDVALHTASAESGDGVDDVVASLDRHRAWLDSPAGRARLLERQSSRALTRLVGAVLAAFDAEGTPLHELARGLARGERSLAEVHREIRERLKRRW